MSKKFTGTIKHSTESIRRLYKAAYHVYDMRQIVAKMFGGATLAAIGILGNLPTIGQAALIMIGCWLMVSKDFPAKCAADDALDVRKKRNQLLPQMTTTFFENHAELQGEGKMKLEYQRFDRLVEDDAYFYLFLRKDSACMIGKDSLHPHHCDEFKTFIAKKTGKEWREMKPWYLMSLYEIVKMFKESK